jgi:ATP/maltotriose-dependent transcriptional regulator MalT
MIRPVRADGRIDTGGVFAPIDRPRVVDRIAAAAQHPIVMLVAPAGYGKSTAMRQYIATLHEPVVRYNVRADGATLLGFVRGFANALSAVAPDVRATVTGAFESAQSSPTPGAELAGWMHAHVKSHAGLIAIDDLHVAEDEPEVSRFLITLVDLSKGRLRWLLASRSYLNLPVGSWMAYEQMELAVDETELCFTRSEARELARASRIGVRDEELARLVEMTEGWPTALSFALRSSTRSLDLNKVEITTRDLVYRYLAEQVYNSLEEDQREFLAVAVMLPEIDIRVLNLAGYDNALVRIEDLRHHGAFIAIDGEHDGVYRCHDLFREFVKHQVSRTGDAVLRVAYRRAAIALEAADRVVDALYAYADAGDGASILRILDLKGLELMEEGNGDVVTRAIEALDVDSRATNSVALAMRGIAESNAGHFEQAEALLHRAAERASDAAVGAQFLLREARVAINRGNHQVRGFLRQIADDVHLPDDTRLEATAMLVVLLTRCGELETAAANRRNALEAIDRSASPAVRVRVLQRIAVALFESGDGLGARELLTRVVDDATRLGMHSLASKACAVLALISGKFLNDQSQRLWYAQKASAAASKGGDVFDLQTAALLLVNVELERGNADRVSAIEKSLAGLRTNDAARLIQMSHAKAECLTWEGRFEEAYRVWSRSWERVYHPGDRIVNAGQCAIYAAASGHDGESTILIARVEELVEQFSERCEAAATDTAFLYCALASAIAGRNTLAQRKMKCATRSDNNHIVILRQAVASSLRVLSNPAVGEGDLGDLLAELTSLGYGGHAKLLRAILDRFCARGVVDAEDVALTPAEAGVLRSLARGLSPKEIAVETGRSINTVQAHIQKAIQKLGCRGRQEAVSIARQRGFLGPSQY